MRLNPIILLWLTLWLFLTTNAVAANSGRDEILATFRAYEALNADFLSSVGRGKGRSGKTYTTLRKEVETYTEGPFETALASAKIRVCKYKDAKVIDALFRIKLATSSSANESPTEALGHMFVCQSDILAKRFKTLPLANQQALFPLLEFGFENSVYSRPKDDKYILGLRQKLKALEP
ncbi:MAG: hypothetical protein WCC58_10745 [Burkholderiales bacterium]